VTTHVLRLARRALALAAMAAIATGSPAGAQQQPLPPLPGERDPLADAAAEGVPAGFYFEPEITIGQYFDDNVFLSDENPQSDAFLRVSPGIETGYRSQRTLVIARYGLDGERYRRHDELRDVTARQQATFDISGFPSQRLTLSAGAGYYETTTPSELNLTSGLVTGRAPAERIQAQGQLHYRTSPNGRLRGEYLIARDRLDGELNSITQQAMAEYRHQLTARTFVSAGYVIRDFHFENRSLRPSHVVMGGIGYRVSPGAVFSVRGGPRMFEDVIGPGVPVPQNPDAPGDPGSPPPTGLGPVTGERRIERTFTPEWNAEFSSTLPRGTFDLAFGRTQTTAFGVPTIIDTTGVTASLLYHPASRVDLRLSPGFYRDEIADTLETRTFRVGAGLTFWITPHVALDGQYVYSHQRGLPESLQTGLLRIRQSVVSVGLRLSARRRPNPPEPLTPHAQERR